MTQQTAVEWLMGHLSPILNFSRVEDRLLIRVLEEQAKEMEKEQAIDLIKQTAMFMSASTMDKEIADMNFEDVYNSYFKK